MTERQLPRLPVIKPGQYQSDSQDAWFLRNFSVQFLLDGETCNLPTGALVNERARCFPVDPVAISLPLWVFAGGIVAALKIAESWIKDRGREQRRTQRRTYHRVEYLKSDA